MSDMTRRGFFQRLFGKKEVPGSHTFAGLQVVLDHDARPAIREELAAIIQSPAPESADDRRVFFKRLIGALGGCEPFFEYGYFETVRSDDAYENFRLFVTDIENALATEEEETGDAVDQMHRQTSRKQFIVLSIAVWFEGGHAPFEEAGNNELGPHYSRMGFGALMREFLRLDFDRVLADAAFIAPGNSEDGFSMEDLNSEGWEYLVPLS